MRSFTPFAWHTFDVRARLPNDWQAMIVDVARSAAEYRELIPSSVTSREAPGDVRIPVHTVDGYSVAKYLPWLYDMYHDKFRDLAQLLSHEPINSAEDMRYGINLNVQLGNEHRYECHVDSNPIQGLLYVTDHPSGTGGELVVSNCGDVCGIDEVDRDATRIYPSAGYLIFFDARQSTHYVSPLRRSEDMRVVVAMNFYTPSSPESARPADLNHHLFGTD